MLMRFRFETLNWTRIQVNERGLGHSRAIVAENKKVNKGPIGNKLNNYDRIYGRRSEFIRAL